MCEMYTDTSGKKLSRNEILDLAAMRIVSSCELGKSLNFEQARCMAGGRCHDELMELVTIDGRFPGPEDEATYGVTITIAVGVAGGPLPTGDALKLILAENFADHLQRIQESEGWEGVVKHIDEVALLWRPH